MKKRGFTLIELLAVIVILAIIALISVPVVTNIISSSKDQTYEISVKNYMSAVENSLLLKETDMNSLAIIDGTYQVMSDGNICIGELSESSCKNILEVDVDGEKPVSGSITISNYKITIITDLTYSNFIADVGSEGEITITLSTSEKNIICTAKDSSKSGSTTIGTKYSCAVNDTTSYNFYVLSKSGNTVNLIMSENLVNEVIFNNEYEYFETLYRASSEKPYVVAQVEDLTTTWTNISILDDTYIDAGGTYTTTLAGRARLPKYSELAGTVCKYQETDGEDNGTIITQPSWYDCASWALGNYWTMDTTDNLGAWAMNTKYNTLDDFILVVGQAFGIRPVISVSTSNLG